MRSQESAGIKHNRVTGSPSPLLVLTLERSMVTDTFDSSLEDESQSQPSHSLNLDQNGRDRQTGSISALLTLTLETSMVTDTFDSSLEESLRVSLLMA
jgi:hypothetical protein